MSDSEIATHKTESASRRRRAKSAPIPDDYRRDQPRIIDPPVVAMGMHNGMPVIVFGEIHNFIYNEFYENLDLRDTTVLVEHSTMLCDISKEHKKSLFNILKGSDWIWYKQVARKKPVVCVDNRIELGLPSSIETQLALRTEITPDTVQMVVGCMMNYMRIFAKPEIKREFVVRQLTPVFTKSMTVIKEQFNRLLKMAQGIVEQSSEDKRHLEETKKKLIKNLMKIAGILVDFNIVKQVEAHAGNGQPIMVFAGAGHAYRLHKFFPKMFPRLEYSTKNRDLLDEVEKIVEE